jgi:hypothetical protein
MTERNAAVELVLKSLFDADRPKTATALNTLDDMGIRGETILNIFVNCNCNAEVFFKKVASKKLDKLKDPV